ncbi:MAG TPA: TetR/AcrR family transcriptional regulator C-terminal domain-containing protein [Micromonosporaceae bacterium]|nr:TetR/AcrR family transcriptional regulator C-terminal domain-containing protein [Micromonosporaceae bacterium]
MPRRTLSREQVLRAAIDLADSEGIESLSMRKLGRALGVEAMSLYNHVDGKDPMLDGMVDLVWREIVLPSPGEHWRAAMHETAVSAHDVLLRHPWVCGLIMSPDRIHPARLEYIDAILGHLRDAGFPAEVMFHAYHAIDAHIIGFTMWEIGHSISPAKEKELAENLLPDLAENLPHLFEHAQQHRAGVGRDGPGGFVFVLDLILDGLERAAARS